MFPRIVALALASGVFAIAAVKQIHVVDRSDIPGYRYERIVAKAYFSLDPALESNRIIADIDLAPRNEAGRVEFSADLFVLKPLNPADGNGTVLFEVSNRGGKSLLSTFNFARGSANPKGEGDFGDGYLLKQGYTLVWLGWQADVPLQPDLMRLFAPVAKQNGKPITGPVRSEWFIEEKVLTRSLADRTMQPIYAPASLDDPSAVLTVREGAYGERRAVPREAWQFARLENGKPVADPGSIYMKAGFEPGKFYELVYTAIDPVVVGLGPAGIRDLVSFLKYDGDGVILLGEQYRHIKRAIGFGSSQSGRFLRSFLYYGFNRDEKGRKVFDGVWPHVAGGGRGSFNHRFAQASRDGHPFLSLLYPTDIFPFTDNPETDPMTGLTDGILARAQKDNVVPRIFYTNSSYEYWGRAASLNHTTVDGKQDVAPPPTTRIYLMSGAQHGSSGAFPPKRNGAQNLSNPNDYRYILRGLLAAMNSWLAEGKEPPPSAYPQIQRDDLVSLGALQFPKIRGVQLPATLHQAWRADYGPEFRAKGIVSKEPPDPGKPFQTLAPQVDGDGNEIAGIRLPEIQAPLATYTGWNLRAGPVAAGEYQNMVGSYLPFARTKVERRKTGDPRQSLEERYSSRQAYLDKISAVARNLAASGYILSADIPLLERRAAHQWDMVTGPRPLEAK